jgi:outer membrane protein OmpA-like peptidoglycan-associated protein
MRSNRSLALLAGIVVALVATGCATKKYVTTEVAGLEAASSQRMDGIESQVEANQSRLDEQEQNMGEISQTAQEALERAIAAGKLAEGKFLFETIFSDDKVQFGFDESALSDTAQQALDIFVEDLKARDQSVYIEIQGHTDSTGSESYNLELGQQRAEAVRRYLNQRGIPLARMSVISYGMSAPIADNGTAEGRAVNRRVTIVVLQ